MNKLFGKSYFVLDVSTAMTDNNDNDGEIVHPINTEYHQMLTNKQIAEMFIDRFVNDHDEMYQALIEAEIEITYIERIDFIAHVARYVSDELQSTHELAVDAS